MRGGFQPYDPFGHWFAGFFDGEGSFGVYPHTGGARGFRCMAKIALRADERPILEEIARWTGVGRIYMDKKGAPATRNPCVAWVVEGRDSCSTLVEIFDRYPLRAKKAGDFALWSAAVREWVSEPKGRPRVSWDRMRDLAAELRDYRVYVPEMEDAAAAV